MHTEPFNIIARADSGIENVKDLAASASTLVTQAQAIAHYASGDGCLGWNNDSFKLAAELKGSERSQALCDNKIDAFIYMVGHPNGAIKEATTSCAAKLVPATALRSKRSSPTTLTMYTALYRLACTAAQIKK